MCRRLKKRKKRKENVTKQKSASINLPIQKGAISHVSFFFLCVSVGISVTRERHVKDLMKSVFHNGPCRAFPPAGFVCLHGDSDDVRASTVRRRHRRCASSGPLKANHAETIWTRSASTETDLPRFTAAALSSKQTHMSRMETRVHDAQTAVWVPPPSIPPGAVADYMYTAARGRGERRH